MKALKKKFFRILLFDTIKYNHKHWQKCYYFQVFIKQSNTY